MLDEFYDLLVRLIIQLIGKLRVAITCLESGGARLADFWTWRAVIG